MSSQQNPHPSSGGGNRTESLITMTPVVEKALSENKQCGFVQLASFSISSPLWSRLGASSFYHLLFLPRQYWKDGSVNIVLSGGWIHCDERWRYRLIPSWSTHDKMEQIMDVPKFWFPDRCNTTSGTEKLVQPRRLLEFGPGVAAFPYGQTPLGRNGRHSSWIVTGIFAILGPLHLPLHYSRHLRQFG